MQPFDYRLAVQNPVAMALQGYQQGQQMVGQREEAAMNREIFDMKKQEFDLNRRTLEQEQARAQEMQMGFAELAERVRLGQATAQDILDFNLRFPEAPDHINDAYKAMTTEQKEAAAREIARATIAFARAPDVGMGVLEERLAAVQDGNMPDAVAGIQAMMEIAKTDPAAAVTSGFTTLSQLLEPDRFKSFMAAAQPQNKETEAFQTLQLRAAAAGLQPGTPEYQKFMEQGGGERAPLVQVIGGEETEFDKAIGKGQADAIVALSTQGQTARRNRQTLTSLQTELAASPTGAEAALKNALGNFGIATEGLSNIQAAEALISQLVPSQRPPGSGTMSDRDVALFKSSLPRLINTPEGNKKIISTMLAMNEYLIREGEIAEMVLDGPENGGITRAEGRRMMRELSNPLANISGDGGIPTVTTDEEFDALPSGTVFIDDEGIRRKKP